MSARWSCSAVGVLLTGMVRLAIEAQARSHVPGRRGNTGSGISRSAEAVTSCPDEGNRDSRANEPAHFKIRSLPLGREEEGYATGLIAAVSSTPHIPSTENTRGMK